MSPSSAVSRRTSSRRSKLTIQWLTSSTPRVDLLFGCVSSSFAASVVRQFRLFDGFPPPSGVQTARALRRTNKQFPSPLSPERKRNTLGLRRGVDLLSPNSFSSKNHTIDKTALKSVRDTKACRYGLRSITNISTYRTRRNKTDPTIRFEKKRIESKRNETERQTSDR